MSMCISTALGLRHFHGIFLHKRALVEILLNSSLRGPCMRSLQMPCLRGACMKALVGGFGRFLYQGLVRSAPAAAGPFMPISTDSLRGPGTKILLTIFFASPCVKILWRFCWNPPQEVLALTSWRSSALVLVWMLVWDAHRKFFYEDLVSSSMQIYIEGPAAAVTTMSNLICYCSIATFAGI